MTLENEFTETELRTLDTEILRNVISEGQWPDDYEELLKRLRQEIQDVH